MLKRLMTSLFQFGKPKNSDEFLEEFQKVLLDELQSDDSSEEQDLTVEVALGAAATTLAEAMILATQQEKPEVLNKIAHSWIVLSQALEPELQEKDKQAFGFKLLGDENDPSKSNN
jgi:hypothetical protein